MKIRKTPLLRLSGVLLTLLMVGLLIAGLGVRVFADTLPCEDPNITHWDQCPSGKDAGDPNNPNDQIQYGVSCSQGLTPDNDGDTFYLPCWEEGSHDELTFRVEAEDFDRCFILPPDKDTGEPVKYCWGGYDDCLSFDWSGDVPGIASEVQYDNYQTEFPYFTTYTIDSQVWGIGQYKFHVKIRDAGNGGDDPDRTVNFILNVKPSPPVCTDADKVPECSGASPDGSGCKSCGGGQDPWPQTSVREPITLVGHPFLPDPPRPVVNNGNSQCVKGHVDVRDTCQGFYIKVKDRCGRCDWWNLGGKPAPGQPARTGDIEFPWPQEDHTINWTLDSNGNVTVQLIYPNGDLEDYSISAPTGATGFMTGSGPSYTVTNGQQTNYAYGSTCDTATTSDGQTYNCYHAAGDHKITKVEQVASGAPSTNMTYVASGAAAGNLQSVVLKNSLGADVTEMDYAYYDDGRLETCTMSNKQLKYDYDDTENTITVSERSNNAPNTVYSQTVYHYGKEGQTGDGQPAEYETWVTRKHLSGPGEDQKTVYAYNYDYSTHQKGLLASVTDPNGKVKSCQYDGDSERPSVQTDSSGFETDYTYNYNGTTAEIDYYAPGNYLYETTSYYYDTENWCYSPYPMVHRDTRGNYTYYVRNAQNLKQVDAIKVSPPLVYEGYQYEPSDEDWATIPDAKEYIYYGDNDSDGIAGQLKTEKTLDANGNSLKEITYKYSDNGVKRGSPTKITTSYWNGSSLQTNTSVASFDAFGRLSYVKDRDDANGKSAWYRYDDLGRETLAVSKWVNDVVDGTPAIYTQKSYSCCGVVWSQDENGNKTHYAYDDANRLTKVWTDVSGQSETNPLIEYSYDAFGNQTAVTSFTDATTGSQTSYTYDANNQLTKKQYPGQLINDQEYGYDKNTGKELWRKVNGAVSLYRYDSLGRLTNIYYNYTGSLVQPIDYDNLTADVTYEYNTNYYSSWTGWEDDGYSQISSMKDSTGTSHYYYDCFGKLIRYIPSTMVVNNAITSVIAYEYDQAGQKTRIYIGQPASSSLNNTSWAMQPLTNLSYDVSYVYAGGRLKEVKTGTTTIASYAYDAAGNRTLQSNGNGTSTEYVYDQTDARHQLSSITQKHGQTVLATFGYPNRDGAGNPTSITDWNGTTTLQYDENNRLKEADYPNPSPDQPIGGQYSYDWTGNQVSPPYGSDKKVYNAAGQLTSWPGMYEYSYNGDGSLNEIKNAQGVVTSSFTYYPNGLLNTATYIAPDGNHTCTNVWDASLNRVQMTINGQTYSYVYDPTASSPGALYEKSGSATTYFYREPNGNLIACQQGSHRYYYHFDDTGSTRLLTDENGNTASTYIYDDQGNPICTVTPIPQPYCYKGEYGLFTHWQDPCFWWKQIGPFLYDTVTGGIIDNGDSEVAPPVNPGTSMNGGYSGGGCGGGGGGGIPSEPSHTPSELGPNLCGRDWAGFAICAVGAVLPVLEDALGKALEASDLWELKVALDLVKLTPEETEEFTDQLEELAKDETSWAFSEDATKLFWRYIQRNLSGLIDDPDLCKRLGINNLADFIDQINEALNVFESAEHIYDMLKKLGECAEEHLDAPLGDLD